MQRKSIEPLTSRLPPIQEQEFDMASAWLYEEDRVEAAPPSFVISDWGIDRYKGDAPEIQFLIEDILPCGQPSLISSLGGVGKSYAMLDLAIRIAAGPGLVNPYCLGGRVVKQGKAVFITAEDSLAAIHRRIGLLISEDDKKKLAGNLFVVPLPDAGGHTALLEQKHGEMKMTTAWHSLFAQIHALGDVAFVCLDPLQTFIQGDINAAPEVAQTFWAAMSQLCAETGATGMVTHHMRKEMEISSALQARMATRGSSAIIDGSRWAYSFWPAPSDMRTSIEGAMGETYGPLDIICGAVVKSNDIGMTDERVFLRDPNSGLLLDCTPMVEGAMEARSTLTREQFVESIAEVNRRWDIGQPFSKAVQSDRFFCRWLCGVHQIDMPAAKKYMKEWLDKGYLIQEHHVGLRMKGLRAHA